MLGLSLHTLAVPDYELVTRLEQLILANQANVSAAVALESALVSSDLGDGFQAGYSHAGRLLAGSRVRGGITVVPPAGVTSAVQRHKVEAGLGWTNTQPVVIRNRLTSQCPVVSHCPLLHLVSGIIYLLLHQPHSRLWIIDLPVHTPVTSSSSVVSPQLKTCLFYNAFHRCLSSSSSTDLMDYYLDNFFWAVLVFVFSSFHFFQLHEAD